MNQTNLPNSNSIRNLRKKLTETWLNLLQLNGKFCLYGQLILTNQQYGVLW